MNHIATFVQEPVQRLVLRGGGRKNREEDEDEEVYFLSLCKASYFQRFNAS